MDIKSLVMILAQVSLVMVVGSVGLLAQWREVVAVARNASLIARAVIAVNVIVPVAAIVICSLLPMTVPIKMAIILMAVSPLAPVLSARLIKAGIAPSLAVGLDVVLVALSVIIVPLTVALLSAVFAQRASISPLAVAKLVTLSVLAPLAVGLAVQSQAPNLAPRLSNVLMKVGFACLALVVIAILYARAPDIFELVGNGSVLAIVLTVVAGIAGGHFLAGPERSSRTAVALAAGMRHPGLAALIAQRNFAEQNVQLAIILYLLTAALVSLVYQAWMQGRAQPATRPAHVAEPVSGAKVSAAFSDETRAL